MNPNFPHNCECCRLVAVDKDVDWYICPQPFLKRATVVGRFGSEPADYWSMDCSTIRRARSTAYAGSDMFKRAIQIMDQHDTGS